MNFYVYLLDEKEMFGRLDAVFLYMVLVGLPACVARCRKRPVREIVQQKNCIQKMVLNFACQGSCENSLSNILRQNGASQSCQISSFRQQTVRLRCFRNGDFTQLKSRDIMVPVVTACACGGGSSGSTLSDTNSEEDREVPVHTTRRSRIQHLLQRLALGRHRGRHRGLAHSRT